MADERDSSRIERLRERGRDNYFAQRREIDDWIGNSGATVLLGLGAAFVVMLVLAMFHLG